MAGQPSTPQPRAAPKISLLRINSVMCHLNTCERPARILVQYGNGPISALCGPHAEARGLAVPEESKELGRTNIPGESNTYGQR